MGAKDSKPILVVTIGIPGCGKSTFADSLASRHGFEIVSSDKIREEVHGSSENQSDPGRIFGIAHERTRNLLESGKNVVFDATSLKPEHRKELLDFTKGTGRKAVAMIFYKDGILEKSLERNAKRSRKVPANVIIRMYRDLEDSVRSVPSEGFDSCISLDSLGRADIRKEGEEE